MTAVPGYLTFAGLSPNPQVSYPISILETPSNHHTQPCIHVASQTSIPSAAQLRRQSFHRGRNSGEILRPNRILLIQAVESCPQITCLVCSVVFEHQPSWPTEDYGSNPKELGSIRIPLCISTALCSGSTIAFRSPRFPTKSFPGVPRSLQPIRNQYCRAFEFVYVTTRQT